MLLFPELCQYSIHVNRVPQHDDIHNQPQRAQLIFLALPVPLTQFTSLP